MKKTHCYKQIGLLSLIVVLLLCCNACRSSLNSKTPLWEEPSHWYKFRADQRNTGTAPLTAGLKSYIKIWKVKTGHEVMSSPVFSPEGDIFIGSHDGCLYRISPSGEPFCLHRSKETVISSPLVYLNQVIWGCFDGNIYSADFDGHVKFELETLDWTASSGNIFQGDIIIASRSGYLYRFSPEGKLVWKTFIGKEDYEIQSSPAVFENRIYIGSPDEGLLCLDEKGSLVWNFKTDGKTPASPAIDNEGNIYIGSWDRYFYSVDPQGNLRWSYETQGEITSSAALLKEGVVFGSKDGYVYSLSLQGELQWKHNTGGPVESSPACDKEGGIYIGTDAGRVAALDKKGSLKWSFETGRPIMSSPALSINGRLVFGCEDEYVYCLE